MKKPSIIEAIVSIAIGVIFISAVVYGCYELSQPPLKQKPVDGEKIYK